MSEVRGRIRKSKVLAFSIDEIVFGWSKNRFGTIPGGVYDWLTGRGDCVGVWLTGRATEVRLGEWMTG